MLSTGNTAMPRQTLPSSHSHCAHCLTPVPTVSLLANSPCILREGLQAHWCYVTLVKSWGVTDRHMSGSQICSSVTRVFKGSLICPVAGARNVGKPRRYGRASVPLALKAHFQREGRAHVMDRSRGRDHGFQTESGRPITFQLPVPLVLPSLTTRPT